MEAQKATIARQAELDRLTAEVRTAEEAKADVLKKQLDAARRESEAAKAAQLQADTKAASLAAQAEKAVTEARAATAAAQLVLQNQTKGKVRFETGVTGRIFLGRDLLGEVGPNAPLQSDSLSLGQLEFRFEAFDGQSESRTVTVTEKAYTTVAFRKALPTGSANGSISIP